MMKKKAVWDVRYRRYEETRDIHSIKNKIDKPKKNEV